jgi:hypothetical protein
LRPDTNVDGGDLFSNPRYIIQRYRHGGTPAHHRSGSLVVHSRILSPALVPAYSIPGLQGG